MVKFILLLQGTKVLPLKDFMGGMNNLSLTSTLQIKKLKDKLMYTLLNLRVMLILFTMMGLLPLPMMAVPCIFQGITPTKDRKSTRLNSSHVKISYAVF